MFWIRCKRKSGGRGDVHLGVRSRLLRSSVLSPMHILSSITRVFVVYTMYSSDSRLYHSLSMYLFVHSSAVVTQPRVRVSSYVHWCLDVEFARR